MFDVVSALKAFSVKCVEPTVFVLVYTSWFLFYWKCSMRDLMVLFVINVFIRR